MRTLVDFVPGDVLESRRGGVDVLRHLAQELATLERNGSIQIQRHIPNVGERLGHLLIVDGTLAAAFHRAEVQRFGIEALLEIESDASTLDASMSLHEMIESTYMSILSQHPEASLLAAEEEAKDDTWWTTVRTPRRTIEREERLPELKPSVSVPEALRRRSEARMKAQGGPVLQQGQAWLENSIEADDTFQLAKFFLENNIPTRIISRQSPPRMESAFNIELVHYRWLSESEHECTLEPSLESIRRTVDTFFEENDKCALFVEGIEYLSGIHGEQRVIEMIRSIIDHTRLSGNMLFVSSNLEAFTTQQRSRLQREFSNLEHDQLKSWLLDFELLVEHPFFLMVDEDEEAVMNQHIESNVQDPVFAPQREVEPRVQQVPLPVEHQTMKIDPALQSKMMEWAMDDEESEENEPSHAEAQVVEEHIETRAKPRTPQRIVRKRKATVKPTKRDSLHAAANHEITLPSLQETDSSKVRPFVPLAPSKEHVFPPTKRSLVQQGMKQAAAVPSGKKVANFPPIKATGQVPIAISTSGQEKPPVKKSPHAREHAVSSQRLPDDESEGNA